MKIQEKIRLVRQSKGYTQEYLAERLNIDPVNYGRIERGQAKLTIERFQDICKILEVKPSEIFEGESFNDFPEKTLFEKIYKEVKEINSKLS